MDVELERLKAQQQNVILAYILWWFLGIFGAHRFYTGQAKGWLYPVLAVIGFITAFILVGYFIFLGLFVWWVIDGFKLHKIVKAQNLAILDQYEQQQA